MPNSNIIQIEATDLDAEPQQCPKPVGESYTRFNEMPYTLIKEFLSDQAQVDILLLLGHRRKAILVRTDEKNRRLTRQIIDNNFKKVSGGFIERFESQERIGPEFDYLKEQTSH